MKIGYFATRGSGLSLVGHVLISRLGIHLGILLATLKFQGGSLTSYRIRAVAAWHFFTPMLLLGADTNDVADAVRTSASDPSFAAFKRGRLRLSETPLLAFAAQISVFPRPFPCLAPLRFSEARGTHMFRRCALARKIAKQYSLFLGTAPATPNNRQRRQT